MKKLILTMLLTACLVSCDWLLDNDTSHDDTFDDDTPLEPDQFYAVNFTNDKFYKVRAENLYEGEKCVIWAEKGSRVTKAKAQEIATEYDSKIRPKIVNEFGKKNFDYKGYHFDDVLDSANWLAGKENKKLTILLLDILDDFDAKTNPAFVAGYFYSGNFYSNGTQGISSNECDMIYVDTYPGLELKPEQTYTTFAHELQHLINFTTTLLVERGKHTDSDGKVTLTAMDTWIDEGLSSQAEHIYAGKNLEDKCKNFYEDKNGTIAKGNNFFVWDNHPEEPMAILDEYSTVYLFFRWLYLQANTTLKDTIFMDIETSDKSDHTIITNVAKGINPAWASWDTLLSAWLAANYYPKNDYGYKGDSYFQNNIKVKTIKTTDNKISLYPGEGVYSSINSPFSPAASGTNIRYRGLSGTSSTIATAAPYISDILLTFNANTNNSKTTASETGTLTGAAASVSSIGSGTAGSRMVIGDAQTETRPYAIDARDYSRIFGRNK